MTGLYLNALTDARTLRVRRVSITPEMLLQLITVPECGVVVDGVRITATKDMLPIDAKALRCAVNERGDIELMIEHETFPGIYEGQPIPVMNPWYSREDVES